MPPRRTKSAPASTPEPLRPSVALPNELLFDIIQQAAHWSGLPSRIDPTYVTRLPGLYWSQRRIALTRFSHVSQQWRSVAHRVLVSHVFLESYNMARKFDLAGSEGGWESLKGVRTVQATGGTNELVDPFRLEESLKKCDTSVKELICDRAGMLKLDGLLSAKGLRHLELQGCCLLGAARGRRSPHFLERLSLNACELIGSFHKILPTFTPHLTTLTLIREFTVKVAVGEAVRDLLLALAPQLLVFDHDFDNTDLLPPSTSFTSLRYLRVTRAWRRDEIKIFHFIMGLPGPLRYLKFLTENDSILSTFATLLEDPSSTFYHLKTFNFAGGFSSGSETEDEMTKVESICRRRGIDCLSVHYVPSVGTVGTHSLDTGRFVTEMDCLHAESRRK